MTAPKKVLIVDDDAKLPECRKEDNPPCSLKTLPTETRSQHRDRIKKERKSYGPGRRRDVREFCENRLRILLSSRGSPHHAHHNHPEILSSHESPPHVEPVGTNLLSLPIEIRQQIFSYTTARDTARLRRVCRALNDIISDQKNEMYLATYFANRELARLQHAVEELTSLEMPFDVDTLMEALHVWTKQRGHFVDPGLSMDSMLKLMSHLFMGKKEGTDLHKNARVWARVASHAIWLHQQYEQGQEIQVDHFFQSGMHEGVLGYSECEKLFFTITNPELQHPKRRISGRMRNSWEQKDTSFPPARMTQLLPFEFDDWDSKSSADRHEVRKMYEMYLGGTPYNHRTRLTHSKPRLLEYLRLPTLPNEVFCYYVKDEWAQKEVEKICVLLGYAMPSRPVRVPLLLKAAILESVTLF